jgi:hypothetical protein
VHSLDHHADSMRLQDAVQTVRYFRRHFFLNLKTLRVDIDESCEFRNSNNSILGQIANVHTSDDRRHFGELRSSAENINR